MSMYQRRFWIEGGSNPFTRIDSRCRLNTSTPVVGIILKFKVELNSF
jgi:hypothetical protein